MGTNQGYKITNFGNKATRRDYSKVSGDLDLPNLVEIQTEAYEWFINEGLQEVFDEVYPIISHNENVKLHFESFSFDEPKFDVEACRERESTYAAPLRAKLKLEIFDKQTGEVIEKEGEEVFLGDLPLMTDWGTFIINGAERVIVSQIVRSPGAYFKTELDPKTNRETYTSELIPSRGTWLEYLTDNRKAALGTLVNMKVDRKRTIASTILFKALGLSLDLQEGEDPIETAGFKKFLEALELPLNDTVEIKEEDEKREFISLYSLLYTAFFGNYQELVDTLAVDKTVTFEDSLRAMFENQRADEIPTSEGAITLMQSKFLDPRRYDLNKAGRFKLHKKLEVFNRVRNAYLMDDLNDVHGNLVFAKDTLVEKREDVYKVRDVLRSGINMTVLPLKNIFAYPEIVSMEVNDNFVFDGRILAKDFGDYEAGTVLTAVELKALKGEVIPIYTGVMARKVTLTQENVLQVLNYGPRLFTLGRLLNDKNEDVLSAKDTLIVDRYTPNVMVSDNTLSSWNCFTRNLCQT